MFAIVTRAVILNDPKKNINSHNYIDLRDLADSGAKGTFRA